MAGKCVKRRRDAARMRESSPRLLHYPLCHILFEVSDRERGPFGHETGTIMHPAIDGQIEQTYLRCSVIRGLVLCHNISARGSETPPDCFHVMEMAKACLWNRMGTHRPTFYRHFKISF